MVQEPGTPCWIVIPLDFWVMRVSFSFRGHDVDTYRTAIVGHGAFELCLPSLGILYQITMLRNTILGRTLESDRSWGEEGRFGHRGER